MRHMAVGRLVEDSMTSYERFSAEEGMYARRSLCLCEWLEETSFGTLC